MHRFAGLVLVAVLTLPAETMASLDPGPVLATDCPPNLVADDFDQDGVVDLAVVSTPSGGPIEVEVFRGLGGGDFTVTPVVTPITSFVIPWDLLVHDFNDDGFLDMLLVPFLGDSVDILYGNGTLSFSPTTISYGGVGSIDAKLADVDLDGDVDILLFSWVLSELRVMLGDGSGGFSPGGTTFLTGVPLCMDVGDVDNDGIIDVAVGYNEGGGGGLAVLLGNGAGGFQPESYYPETSQSVSSIQLRDLNNDGNLDIVAPDSGQSGVLVKIGDGAGGFEPKTVFPTFANAYIADVADFDGDGNLDLVVGGNTLMELDTSVALLLGDGSGDFTLEQQFTSPDNYGFFVGDLNGDSTPDLASANGPVDTASVYFNDVLPPNDPPFTRGDVNGDGTFSPIPDVLFLLAFQFVVGSAAPPCLAAADIDGNNTITGLVDALYGLNYQFSGGPPIPSPFPGCGVDAGNTLACASTPCP